MTHRRPAWTWPDLGWLVILVGAVLLFWGAVVVAVVRWAWTWW